jgi:hypothetical protein
VAPGPIRLSDTGSNLGNLGVAWAKVPPSTKENVCHNFNKRPMNETYLEFIGILGKPLTFDEYENFFLDACAAYP